MVKIVDQPGRVFAVEVVYPILVFCSPKDLYYLAGKARRGLVEAREVLYRSHGESDSRGRCIDGCLPNEEMHLRHGVL